MCSGRARAPRTKRSPITRLTFFSQRATAIGVIEFDHARLNDWIRSARKRKRRITFEFDRTTIETFRKHWPGDAKDINARRIVHRYAVKVALLGLRERNNLRVRPSSARRKTRNRETRAHEFDEGAAIITRSKFLRVGSELVRHKRSEFRRFLEVINAAPVFSAREFRRRFGGRGRMIASSRNCLAGNSEGFHIVGFLNP